MPKDCLALNCKWPIWGKGYCKIHQHLRSDKMKDHFRNAKRKPIPKFRKGRKKPVFDKKLQIADWNFYLEIWEEREHICIGCGEFLGNEPLTIYFDHILEKEIWEELRHIKENIALVCWNCHTKKGNGHPTPNHKKLIDKLLNKYSNETF